MCAQCAQSQNLEGNVIIKRQKSELIPILNPSGEYKNWTAI